MTERKLPVAVRDPVLRALLAAPLDNEPDQDDADGGLSGARREAREGKCLSHEEVKRDEILRGTPESSPVEIEPVPRAVRIIQKGRLQVAIPVDPDETLTAETVRRTQDALRQHSREAFDLVLARVPDAEPDPWDRWTTSEGSDKEG